MEETTIRRPADFAPPGFELTRFFRKGGMAELWLARQLNPNREVVIKFLLPQFSQDPQYTERFEREVTVQAKLGHPNIVPIYAAGEINQRRFIAMEYLAEGSLAELLKQGPLTPARAIEVTIDIARALGAAHRSGYIHRDVKPDNILFRSDGRTAVLSDFGIAGVMQDQSLLTRLLVQIGTPAYMSPEQAHNQDVREPSDIYSLGVVFYEMLTGSKPPAMQGEHKPPQLPRHLQALQKVLNRMLAFRSSDRFGNTDQLIDVLIQARIGLPQSGRHAMPNKTVALAVLAGVVAIGAIYAVTRPGGVSADIQQQTVRQLGDARQQLQQLPALQAALAPQLEKVDAELKEMRNRQRTGTTPDAQVTLFDTEQEAATLHAVAEQFNHAVEGEQGVTYIEGLLTLAEGQLRDNRGDAALTNLQTALNRLNELKAMPDAQWQVAMDTQAKQAQQLSGRWTLDTCDKAIAWSVNKLQATAVWPNVATFALHLRPAADNDIAAMVIEPKKYRGLEFNYHIEADKMISLDKQTRNTETFTRCT